MSDERVKAVDLASVYETAEKDDLIRILAWGDRVEVEDITDARGPWRAFCFWLPTSRT